MEGLALGAHDAWRLDVVAATIRCLHPEINCEGRAILAIADLVSSLLGGAFSICDPRNRASTHHCASTVISLLSGTE